MEFGRVWLPAIVSRNHHTGTIYSICRVGTVGDTMVALPRLAVVGCGYWGSKHVRVISETPGVDLALAIDVRCERLESLHATYPNVPVSSEFDAIHQDHIDGVVISTPISTHFTLAREALRAGKHVLVEKPLATSTAECQELISIAERQNRVLMVGHTYEYHPAITYLRDIVRRGDLGDIYYINSARLNLGLFQPDANALWDLAPHDLSIIFYILGQHATSLSAWGHSHILPNIADVVYVNLEFGSGMSAHVHVSWLDPNKVRRVTIVGSKAMAVFDDVAMTEKIRIYDKRFTFSANGNDQSGFTPIYHYGNLVIPPVSSTEPLRSECQDFVNSIATGHHVRSDGHSGLRVVTALEAASRSMAKQGAVEELGAPSAHASRSMPPTAISHAFMENGNAASP